MRRVAGSRAISARVPALIFAPRTLQQRQHIHSAARKIAEAESLSEAEFRRSVAAGALRLRRPARWVRRLRDARVLE